MPTEHLTAPKWHQLRFLGWMNLGQDAVPSWPEGSTTSSGNTLSFAARCLWMEHPRARREHARTGTDAGRTRARTHAQESGLAWNRTLLPVCRQYHPEAPLGNEWGLSVRLTYRQKILPASICLVIDDRLPPMTNCRRLKDEYAVDSHELRKAVSEKTAQWILEILPYA